MNNASNMPPSKGMMMIAAYRAERLLQRPTLRTSLHQSHVARRAARNNGAPANAEPCHVGHMEAPAPVATIAEPKAINPGSVFAGLVSTAVAQQQSEATLNRRVLAEDAPTDISQIAETEIAATETVETETVETETAEAPPAAVRNEAEPQPSEEAMAPHPSITAQDMSDGGQQETTPPAAPPMTDPQSVTQPLLAYDPPLAEIGFGPGMLIRLSQLGLHTTGDLAQADAGQLRSALGDISRLVDVDAWIRSAHQTTCRASTSPNSDCAMSGAPGPEPTREFH